ncbi:MAG: site-2 protease family protein [Treponema sp.]|nr:site-2 protease family protein [Treponema sp.]
MTVIYGLLLLNVLVFIHELGHFFCAKLCSVAVESFSIGMGPVLFHREISGTDWRISLFPIGGYCGMKGEKNASEEDEFILHDADSLYGTRPAFRTAIGFAGPFCNLLFALVAYSVIAWVGYSYYAAGNTITLATDVYPGMHSAAADAGLLSGDRVLRIGDKEISDFSDLYAQVAVNPDTDLDFEVQRGEEILHFSVHTDFDKSSGTGKIGVVSDASSVQKKESVRYPFLPGLFHGARETVNTVSLTFKGISLLFKGASVTESVSGPARITTMLGGTAKAGFAENFRTGICSVLEFMALISVSLFIMNLLPIPILDGYLVLTSLVETFFKVRVSPKVRVVVQYVGFALIALLFAIAMTGDIKYFIGVLVKK